jgi:uncharacterized RDD family membrane protein YckC
MLLMGIGLLGGAIGTVLVASFKSIDEQVGTNGSAAAAVLGVGLIIAAINPSGSVAWVRAGILYGLIVLLFEIVSAIHGKGFHLGPVIFGLAFTLLLIAAYPERKRLLGDMVSGTGMSKSPVPDDNPAPEAAEPEKAG